MHNYATHVRVVKLTKDLDASRAQVAELQKRMQSPKPRRDFGPKSGNDKERPGAARSSTPGPAESRESRLEREQKEQMGK